MAFSDLHDPESIRQAIDEFDQVGREGFLDRYGFGKSREYFIAFNGQLYDSKAIVGAAHKYEFPELGPLSSRDFSGGDATVRPKLESLGFPVVRFPHQAIPQELVPRIAQGRVPENPSPRRAREPGRSGQQVTAEAISQELSRRLSIWHRLKEHGGPAGVTPALIKELRIHRGMQGIFRDRENHG